MKKTLVTLTVLLVIFCGVAIAATPVSSIPKVCHVAWPESDFVPPASINAAPLQPTTGIYWFGTHNPNGQETQKAAYTSSSNMTKSAYMQMLKEKGYFDPNKPTIIFVHGWQPGSTKNKTHFDFCYDYPGVNGKASPTYNVLSYWKGWNVGVFYWTQFADETESPMDAEAKIYSMRGSKGMRWAYLQQTNQGSYNLQYCDNGMSNCQPIHQDISQMLESAYQNALPSNEVYKGSELRIAGQSLGTQLSIQLTDWVLKNTQSNDLPMPTRLSLMDPYVSPKNLEGNEHLPFSVSVAQYAADTVKDIQSRDSNLPIDVYRTSRLSYAPTGNPASSLMDEVAYMKMDIKYLDPTLTGLSLNGLLHRASIYLYFASKKDAPNGINNGSSNYANADATNGEILSLMGKKRYQVATGVGAIGEENFLKTQDDIFSTEAPLNSIVSPPNENNNNAGNMEDIERLGAIVGSDNVGTTSS
jgi:hypothetical protein